MLEVLLPAFGILFLYKIAHDFLFYRILNDDLNTPTSRTIWLSEQNGKSND